MRYPWLRLGIFVLGCLFPSWWLYEAATNQLGPDLGKIIMDRLGLGALIFLLITLSMTPLQRLTGWSGWIVIRRQLGLWSFAYIVLHMITYMVFILGLDWGQFGVVLRKRPYIIVGALALGENRIVGSGQALDLANGTVTEVGGNAFTEVSSTFDRRR